MEPAAPVPTDDDRSQVPFGNVANAFVVPPVADVAILAHRFQTDVLLRSAQDNDQQDLDPRGHLDHAGQDALPDRADRTPSQSHLGSFQEDRLCGDARVPRGRTGMLPVAPYDYVSGAPFAILGAVPILEVPRPGKARKGTGVHLGIGADHVPQGLQIRRRCHPPRRADQRGQDCVALSMPSVYCGQQVVGRYLRTRRRAATMIPAPPRSRALPARHRVERGLRDGVVSVKGNGLVRAGRATVRAERTRRPKRSPMNSRTIATTRITFQRPGPNGATLDSPGRRPGERETRDSPKA